MQGSDGPVSRLAFCVILRAGNMASHGEEVPRSARGTGGQGTVTPDETGLTRAEAFDGRGNYRFLPAMEAGNVDHLQLRELFTYWCRIREGRRMPPRSAIRSRDITRHAPFLAVVELLRNDGSFRVLGCGREAQKFWQFGGATEDRSLIERHGLMRALMRHQAANRVPVTLRSTLPDCTPAIAFSLIALPLSDDGEEVSCSLIEVLFREA